jgi:superfamily I DNA/RNA helicase
MTTLIIPRLPLDHLQRAAAEAPEGPVLIIGGPGSGKTHTLIGRIAVLLREGAPPRTIAYLSFSSHGAHEVRRQLNGLEPEAAPDLFAGTLHQYASHFLRRAGAAVLGIPPHYTIWDPQQAAETIAELARASSPEDPEMGQEEIKELLHWHDLDRTRLPEDALPAPRKGWQRLAGLYTAEKRRQDTLDLGDLIPLAVRAMEIDPRLRADWNRSRSRHLLVDEFQDVTPAQYRLLQMITGPTRSIAIATDPNQSIYAWRGAEAGLLEQFQLDHQRAGTHLLRVNHRSTGALTGAAARITDHGPMRGLHHAYQSAVRPEGEPPALLNFPGPPQDMDGHVLDMAQELNRQGYAWEDMACIYRRHLTSARIITQLVHRDIPYTLLGENRTRKSGDANCIASLLSSVLNPLDRSAFSVAASTEARTRHRRLNPHVSQEIARISREQGINLIEAAGQHLSGGRHSPPVARDLRHIVNAWKQLDRILESPEVSLYNLCRRAHGLLHDARGGRGLPVPDSQTARLLTLSETTARLPGETAREHLSRFLELLSAASQPEHRSPDNDDPFAHHRGISLSTVHGAKGLQWKVVWVLDASDHLMPGPVRDSPGAAGNLEEEQRIFYVAATRAADRLYFCSAEGSKQELDAAPSRFLDALGDITRHEVLEEA